MNEASSRHHSRLHRQVESQTSLFLCRALLFCLQLSAIVAVCAAFPKRLPIGKQCRPLHVYFKNVIGKVID